MKLHLQWYMFTRESPFFFFFFYSACVVVVSGCCCGRKFLPGDNCSLSDVVSSTSAPERVENFEKTHTHSLSTAYNMSTSLPHWQRSQCWIYIVRALTCFLGCLERERERERVRLSWVWFSTPTVDCIFEMKTLRVLFFINIISAATVIIKHKNKAWRLGIQCTLFECRFARQIHDELLVG